MNPRAWLFVSILTWSGTPEVPPVTRAEVEKLHRELIPKREEAWETIGWNVDLLAARDEAVRTGRPLFLWAMNGHPLGCV
jgi:hypothetical protein